MDLSPRLARAGGAAVAAIVVAALLGACSPGSGASIKITEAWARPSSAMAAAGAAYLTIQNTGSTADALVGASSPAAATVEVHETVAMTTPAASDGGMGAASPSAPGGAMMGMRPISRLEIPAGGTVELKPGSYHVMLIGLRQDLTAGSTIQLTLTFEKAGNMTVTATVRES